MGTQWNVGPGGPVGLIYPALESVLRLLSIPRKEWPVLFEAIGVMEDAALETIRKQNK